MSFDFQNWGGARSITSERLFRDLSRSRPNVRSGGTTPSVPPPPPPRDLAHGTDLSDAGKRRREAESVRDGLHTGPQGGVVASPPQFCQKPYIGWVDNRPSALHRRDDTTDAAPPAKRSNTQLQPRHSVSGGTAAPTVHTNRNEANGRARSARVHSTVASTDPVASSRRRATGRVSGGAGARVTSSHDAMSAGDRQTPLQWTTAPTARPAIAVVVDLTASDDEDSRVTEQVPTHPVRMIQHTMQPPPHLTPVQQPIQPLRQPVQPLRQPSPSLTQATAPVIPSQPTCSCGVSIAFGEAVTCASSQCAIKTFHKGCVGLAKRKVIADNWTCVDCRPKPWLQPNTSSSQPAAWGMSQTQPSSQMQPPSSPPTMTVARKVARLPIAREEPELPLHPEQSNVVGRIMAGANVFYTGSAGTGKSTVLKAFVRRLRVHGRKVDIVAPTGIAALNVGGQTMYAYAGWHPNTFKTPLRDFIRNANGKHLRNRLCLTDILVIDEISMVERDVLNRLDAMMRDIRSGWKPERGQKSLSKHHHMLPFGGVQVIITGDWCQLPPVRPFRYCMPCGKDELPGYSKKGGATLVCKRCRAVYEDKDKWAFRSDAWHACNFEYFELRHIHRQSDKAFIDILQKCRYGQPLSAQQEALLLQDKPDPVGAVKLMPTRAEVNRENDQNYHRLLTPERVLESHDCFLWRNKNEPGLQKNGELKYPHRPDGPLKALDDHRFEENLKLKVGMLVILVVNLDLTCGLVNGSQGKIIGFEKHDEGRVFPPQEPRTLRKGGEKQDAPTQPDHVAVKEFQVREFISRNRVTSWPIVEFTNGHVQPIYAHCQLSELGSEEPYSYLGRTQVPLLAAWAITVHKSQGMTLERVIVDLHRSFEKEMAYVALSRARTLEGLKVVRLPKEPYLGVNPEVEQFLREHGMGIL